MVNVGTVINKALTKATDPTNPLRARMVTWFNDIVYDVLHQPRVWFWLTEPLSLPIVSNQVTLPAGVSEIVEIQVGNIFFTQSNQLSDARAAQIDQAAQLFYESADYDDYMPNDLMGYTLDATGTIITFHPPLATGPSYLTDGVTGQYITGDGGNVLTDDTPATMATVTVEQDVATDYTDGATTIFPSAFEHLFVVGVQESAKGCLEESTPYKQLMAQMRAWDNRRKPRPQFNRHGYIRSI